MHVIERSPVGDDVEWLVKKHGVQGATHTDVAFTEARCIGGPSRYQRHAGARLFDIAFALYGLHARHRATLRAL